MENNKYIINIMYKNENEIKKVFDNVHNTISCIEDIVTLTNKISIKEFEILNGTYLVNTYDDAMYDKLFSDVYLGSMETSEKIINKQFTDNDYILIMYTKELEGPRFVCMYDIKHISFLKQDLLEIL
ncbi:hypothetical protein [Clostridium tertium]|uniref:hypothetical protein n=1 Tax=Clostridium tertium TaxID=1559 RepID=UPI0023B3147B|nr:hypothetical protein [Clostridium tertium]